MNIIKKLIPFLILTIIFVFGIVCTSEAPEQTTTDTEEIEKEETEEEITQEEDQFLFDEYLDGSKVRDYEMIEEEDISIKALGDKLFSEYSAEELEKLPKNYRMKYSIVVSRDITEEELKSTLAHIIKEKSEANPDIDEIVVFSWYFEGSVGQTAAMGKAEWCPGGEWGGLSPEIAETNNRSSYKIVFSQIEIQDYEDEEKYGLSEEERMQAFYDLVKLQDSIPLDDPEWDKKNEESYLVIAEKYGITEEQMHDISTEGLVKGWPMPPIEEEVNNTAAEQSLITSFSDSMGNVIKNSTNNSAGEDESGGNFTISSNNTIEFNVASTGENDLYKFGYCICESEDSPYILIQDWSTNNNCTWIVPDKVPGGTMVLVLVMVKNNDGIETLGGPEMGYCDDSSAIGYFAEIN
jgi:hypothetical protein